jgi:alcohol dehydrogenase YqhD (iron-dependent ADH family)
MKTNSAITNTPKNLPDNSGRVILVYGVGKIKRHGD